MNFPKDIEKIIYNYYDTNVHYEKYIYVLNDIRAMCCNPDSDEKLLLTMNIIEQLDVDVRYETLSLCYCEMMPNFIKDKYLFDDFDRWIYRKL